MKITSSSVIKACKPYFDTDRDQWVVCIDVDGNNSSMQCTGVYLEATVAAAQATVDRLIATRTELRNFEKRKSIR